MNKKILMIILKCSTLIFVVLLVVICFFDAKNKTKINRDYAHLPIYSGTLTLNNEIQIVNSRELCIYSYSENSYAYKNIYTKEDDIPILTYNGQRLNFTFESVVLSYNGDNSPVKCKITSTDAKIKGTFEFELPTLNAANEKLKTKTYLPYLFSGIVLALLATLLKFISRTDDVKDEKIADYAYAVKNYDLSKEENEVLKGIITDGIKKAGYDSLESFIKISQDKDKMRFKYNIFDILGNYLSASAWLCGITAFMIALIITDITLGLGTKWLIFIPLAIIGYGLKFYAKCIKDKEKRNDLA